MYQEKLREMNRFALIGMLLGATLVVVIIISALSDIGYTTATLGDIFAILGLLLLISFLFMGIPYIWKLLGTKLPLSQAGTLVFWVIIFLLRMFISFGFAWILFPLIYLYTYIQAKREKQKFMYSDNTDSE